MSDVLECLSDLQRRKYLVSVKISCRLGNPAEETIITKTGTIGDLVVNAEKPRQTSFYINYPNVGAGGGVRFKAHPHEVLSIFNEDDVLYSADIE